MMSLYIKYRNKCLNGCLVVLHFMFKKHEPLLTVTVVIGEHATFQPLPYQHFP